MAHSNNLPIKSALNDPSFTQLNGLAKWQAKQATSEMVKSTLVATLHEQGRGVLTNTALENVGALSALEAHLIEIAPQGAERYRHIVDAYALSAAQKIARW
jgi:hypothetical protein